VIGFRRFALAILACAEDPRRAAEVFAKQAPNAYAEGVELGPNEFVDPGRKAVAVAHQCAQLPQLVEGERGYADSLPLRRDERMPPFGR
jgi:hypothetical protein